MVQEARGIGPKPGFKPWACSLVVTRGKLLVLSDLGFCMYKFRASERIERDGAWWLKHHPKVGF